MKNIVTKDGLKITTTNTGLAGVVGTVNLSVLDSGQLHLSNEDTDKIKRVSGIVSSGADYVIGDILTVTGGAGTGALLRVADVDGGGIATFGGVTVINGGSGYINSDVTYSVTGGSGTGFEFNALVATGGIQVGGYSTVDNLNGITMPPSAPSIDGSVLIADVNNIGTWTSLTLDVLNDVVISTTPVAGDTLEHNGTEWDISTSVFYVNLDTSDTSSHNIHYITENENNDIYIMTFRVLAQAFSVNDDLYSVEYMATCRREIGEGGPELIVRDEATTIICNDTVSGEVWNIGINFENIFVKSGTADNTRWSMRVETVKTLVFAG